MNRKRKGPKKAAAARAVGFWARSEEKPEVLSIRNSTSRLGATLAFLRRIIGWDRRKK